MPATTLNATLGCRSKDLVLAPGVGDEQVAVRCHCQGCWAQHVVQLGRLTLLLAHRVRERGRRTNTGRWVRADDTVVLYEHARRGPRDLPATRVENGVPTNAW